MNSSLKMCAPLEEILPFISVELLGISVIILILPSISPSATKLNLFN